MLSHCVDWKGSMLVSVPSPPLSSSAWQMASDESPFAMPTLISGSGSGVGEVGERPSSSHCGVTHLENPPQAVFTHEPVPGHRGMGGEVNEARGECCGGDACATNMWRLSRGPTAAEIFVTMPEPVVTCTSIDSGGPTSS